MRQNMGKRHCSQILLWWPSVSCDLLDTQRLNPISNISIDNLSSRTKIGHNKTQAKNATKCNEAAEEMVMVKSKGDSKRPNCVVNC